MTLEVPPRWVRRVLLPAAIAVEVALGGLLAATALLGVLAWPITPRRRAFRVAAFGCVYVGVEVAVASPVMSIWVRER